MVIFPEPRPWPDYELIDTGNFYKLERFGRQVVARPEPQAIWETAINFKDWDGLADAYFRKEKEGKQGNDEKGQWDVKPGTQRQWFVNYTAGDLDLVMKLSLTAFKHVGIFPEQVENWHFVHKTLCTIKVPRPLVLNLFAYTGGASLAARQAGSEVVHLDSVKPVVSWARENMEASKIDGIRWMVEDAAKFVRREGNRGNRYHGIILDPPAYGRGPEGEKWVLEDGIYNLLKNCRQILDPDHGFILLNLYSMGFSPLIAKNLLETIFEVPQAEAGELFLRDRAGRPLPLGIFSRFVRK